MKGTLTQVISGVISYLNDEVSTRKTIPAPVHFIGRNIYKKRRIFFYFQGNALYKIPTSIFINLWLTRNI